MSTKSLDQRNGILRVEWVLEDSGIAKQNLKLDEDKLADSNGTGRGRQ